MTLRIGLIGCGRISDIYIENCAHFEGVEIVACASLDLAESQVKAARHGTASRALVRWPKSLPIRTLTASSI